MTDKRLTDYRENFIDEHGYLYCENCGMSSCYKLELHHIIYRSEVGKQSDVHNISNLMLLCDVCHQKFHNKKSVRNKLVKSRGLNKLYGRNFIIKKEVS